MQWSKGTVGQSSPQDKKKSLLVSVLLEFELFKTLYTVCVGWRFYGVMVSVTNGKQIYGSKVNVPHK